MAAKADVVERWRSHCRPRRMFGYHEISLARLIRSNLQLDCSCCFRRSLMTRVKYPCPCCGYLVFDESPGSHEICPICFWEDDLTQLRFPLMSGGANPVSLIEAQENKFREESLRCDYARMCEPQKLQMCVSRSGAESMFVRIKLKNP